LKALCNAATQAIPAKSVWQSSENTPPALCLNTHSCVPGDSVQSATLAIKESKHYRSNQQHHMRTSNEHTAPTSACNTATDTLYGVL